MCKLSIREEELLVNLKSKTRKALAVALGIEVDTINAYLSRIRKKRKAAKALLRKTNPYKSILYPKRRGE